MLNRVSGVVRRLGSALSRATTVAEKAVSDFRLSLVPGEYKPTRLRGVDYWIAAALGFIGAVIAVWACAAFNSRVNDYWNIYFHADPNRILTDTSLRPSLGFSRKGGVHPIFSILMLLPLQALGAIGLSQLTAFTILLVISDAMSVGIFYFAMRGLGLSIPAAVGFAGALMTSAAFVHWTPFVETFSFALLAGVAMLLVATSCRYSLVLWTLGSAGTLSVTITNWVLGLAAAFFRLPPRKFVLVSTAAFVLVAVGALIQRAIMPPAPVFFNPRVIFQEKAFTQIELEKHGLQRWSLADDARSVLLTSAVAPPPRLEDDPTPFGVFRLVTNQHSPPTESLVGAGAIVCWIFLLGVGLWGAWRTLSHRAVALAVGSFALFQLAMHLVYGEITFLYALNFFPALLTLAAFGWLNSATQICNLRRVCLCRPRRDKQLWSIPHYGTPGQ